MIAGHRHAARGFTLIEILVVLAIIGIILGLVIVKLEQSDSSRVRGEADRLSLVLERARDSATITGRSVAFSSDGNGYQFWLADANNGEWKAMAAESLEPHRLPEGVQLVALQVNGHDRPLGERLVFSAQGVADTFALTLRAGEAKLQLTSDVMGRIELQNAPN